MSRLGPITQGNTVNLTVPVLNADATALDLTDFPEIVFTLKRSAQDSDAAAIFQGRLTTGGVQVNSPATDGLALVTIPSSATAYLRPGRLYFWDVEVHGSMGEVYTPCSGDVLAEARVTHG